MVVQWCFGLAKQEIVIGKVIALDAGLLDDSVPLVIHRGPWVFFIVYQG